MPDLFPVQIADLTAWGFANPETMPWGGAQRVGVHQLPAGVRIIDSLGPDDSDITWKGMFLTEAPGDPDAVEAARYIDYLRKLGGAVTLTWDVFQYKVIIEHFKASYEFPTRVSFEILCKVVEDQTQPVTSFDSGNVDNMVSDDYSNIISLAVQLNMKVPTGLPSSFSLTIGASG
jgi:hypothetical protein